MLTIRYAYRYIYDVLPFSCLQYQAHRYQSERLISMQRSIPEANWWEYQRESFLLAQRFQASGEGAGSRFEPSHQVHSQPVQNLQFMPLLGQQHGLAMKASQQLLYFYLFL